MVVTVLMHDAYGQFGPNAARAASEGRLYDILYADDTLQLETDEDRAQQYMGAVTKAGEIYGLQLNWSKVEVLSSGCNTFWANPLGGNRVPSINF